MTADGSVLFSSRSTFKLREHEILAYFGQLWLFGANLRTFWCTSERLKYHGGGVPKMTNNICQILGMNTTEA